MASADQRELVVDNFAGGGGASTGIRMALGRDVDIAINHDESAIAMHKVNHPTARHYQEDVWAVDPVKACDGKPVGLAWFSPDCKHFSKAKGGKPCDKNIRGLAWVAVRWAKAVRPRVIMMENVEEIQTWGPLLPDGHPDPQKAGQTYRRFIRALEDLGYEVQTNILVAADYGSPTTRQRWFLVARCDGKPIVWPEPTHMPRAKIGTLYGWANASIKPWVPVADVIDWTLPCPSIFASKAEIREQYGVNAVRPLSDNTLARIARGIKRFVIDNPEPFVIDMKFRNEPQSIKKPLSTVTAVNSKLIVSPVMVSIGQNGAGDKRVRGVDDPLRTVVGKNESCLCMPVIVRNNTGTKGRSPKDPIGSLTTGEQMMMVAPSMVQIGYGEREGQKPRVLDIQEPIRTIVGTQKHALVSAFIHQYYDGGYKCDGRDVREPCPTVTGCGHNSLCTAHVVKLKGDNIGQECQEPLQTIMAGGRHYGEVCTFLTQFNNGCEGQDLRDPINTVTAGDGHFGEVRAFLLKYYGNEGYSDVADPMPTATSKDRFGLVTVEGVDYAIVDIGLRMLTPRELFDANGFPHDYEIEQGIDGRTLSKAEQVEKCGNAVPPQLAEALVRANLPEMCKEREAA